ncbi:oxidoreductase [Hymenobacter terrenus]|uniref:oxidoreductase n=1 Tax=Hymenobacter terrenus TaxID=1629124 RepID=UPI00061A0979|nr:oxidoreductase [Hymenobacter terrenus]
MDTTKVWLITGTSSGFGRALAQEVIRQGYRLVATARNPEVIADLAALAPDRVLALELDVTKPATIKRAVMAAIARFSRIDVLVNDAGFGLMGPVEEATDKQFRYQFEVNVFGLMNVTRAVLPHLRQQRWGLIVNFSSMAGFAAYKSLGVYSASKFAVDGLSEDLALELEPFGIGVMIVEPGPFNTSWIGKNAVSSPRTIAGYEAVWQDLDAMRRVYADRSLVGDPAKAAKAIVLAVEAPNRPLRLPLHEFAIASIRGKLQKVKENLDAWEAVSLDVHYADGRALDNASVVNHH